MTQYPKMFSRLLLGAALASASLARAARILSIPAGRGTWPAAMVA